MHKRFPINYLKTFRKRTGFLLQDMASIIGINSGTLSKIEMGKVVPNLNVVLAYYLILKIPIEKLFKNHIKESLTHCLDRSLVLKEEIQNEKTSVSNEKRLELLEIIIERLSDSKIYHEQH